MCTSLQIVSNHPNQISYVWRPLKEDCWRKGLRDIIPSADTTALVLNIHIVVLEVLRIELFLGEIAPLFAVADHKSRELFWSRHDDCVELDLDVDRCEECYESILTGLSQICEMRFIYAFTIPIESAS